MGSELLMACAFSTVKCGPGQETSLTVGFKASVIKCAPAELLTDVRAIASSPCSMLLP